MSATQTIAAWPASVRDEVEPLRFGARLHPGLEAAEVAWQTIEAGGHCTPFQRLSWAKAIVGHLGVDPASVFVVEVYDCETGRPLMVMPLVKRSERLWTTLTWLGADVCDYCAPLVAANVAWTPAIAGAAWRAARKALPQADVMRIAQVPTLVAGVSNPLLLLGKTRQTVSTTCGLAVDGVPETVLQRCCDPSFVKKLGKTGRRLAQRGAVRLVEARTEAEIEDLFDVLLQQRLSRFGKLDRSDIFRQPAVVAFYRAAALDGLGGGPVRLLGLRVGDQWAGTYYGLKHAGAFQGLIVTIADESWRTCSPGLHVHAHVIRWVAEQGLKFFDMSVGPASYKDQIGGRRSALYAVDQALSIRGFSILFVLHAFASLKDGVRKRPKSYAAAKATIEWIRTRPWTLRSIAGVSEQIARRSEAQG